MAGRLLPSCSSGAEGRSNPCAWSVSKSHILKLNLPLSVPDRGGFLLNFLKTTCFCTASSFTYSLHAVRQLGRAVCSLVRICTSEVDAGMRLAPSTKVVPRTRKRECYLYQGLTSRNANCTDTVQFCTSDLQEKN